MIVQFHILICLYFTFGCVGILASSSKYQNFASSENDDNYLSQRENILEKSYHGLIRENESFVEITPLIKVDEEKVCSFHILNKPYHEIPFKIELVNNLGILKARRVLNCEKRKSYHFEIVAIFCDQTPSNKANVHITVIDINEYAPTFMQPSYVTEVDEGRLYNEIIRVEATDKDCTPLYGDVCKYEILNNDEPFTIDNEGSIKNIQPLSHKLSHNHILSVIAYDCAMKESAPIMVSIKVRLVCEAKFSGIPERIDYLTTSTESLYLFPNARLDLCDVFCNNQQFAAHTSIVLKTKHISFGCDRDITNCSSKIALVDLLPRNVEWTKDISYDEGFEPIFHFDSSSGVIVPNSILAHHDFSISPFSIITVFRHNSRQLMNNKHIKEHIICSADDHKMNRHHMALFIRNCRLIMLLRKNFNEGDLNIFSPAEWRWKIPHVCDNEWHHYVINVDQLSKVELYIDGILFENSIEDRHSNPEIIDDWPLHAAHGVNTTLSIGACFQSSENRLKHGFKGDISEIEVYVGGILSAEDIKCGTNCAEHLVVPSDVGTHIKTSAQLNEIYIESNSKNSMEQLLRKVQYINTKENPTIGRRNIEVLSTIICANQSAIKLPTVETYIMVNEMNSVISTSVQPLDNNYGVKNRPYAKNMRMTPAREQVDEIKYTISGSESSAPLNLKINIRGNANKLVSYLEIKSGIYILDHVNINVLKDNKLSPKETLDSCTVIVFPSLNPDHEEIKISGDESLSPALEIKTNINKDGVEMLGNDNVKNYMKIIQSLVYSNKKPAYYLNRVFKLWCSKSNMQYKSTDFTLTLTVLHPKQIKAKPTNLPTVEEDASYNAQHILKEELDGRRIPNVIVSENKMFSYSLIHTHDIQEPKLKLHSIIHEANSSHSFMPIILICVFLVILLVGVSIARIKNRGQKYRDRIQPCPKVPDESLIWDDSALTITINPMQADALSGESSDSESTDSEDDDALKDGYGNLNQLEWDNTNMFSTVN